MTQRQQMGAAAKPWPASQKSIGALGDWQGGWFVSLPALSRKCLPWLFLWTVQKVFAKAVKSRINVSLHNTLEQAVQQLQKQPDAPAMNRSFCLPQQQLLLINFLALKPVGMHSAVWPTGTLQNFRKSSCSYRRLVMFDRTDRSHIGVWWWTVDKMMLTSIFLLMVLGAVLVMALARRWPVELDYELILSGNS